MPTRFQWITLLLLLTLAVGVLPSATPSQAQAQPTLYVAFVWHQHQPVYYKDPETNVYERPWVRVHAAKNYLDMVTTLADFPEIRATFNLTPSLMLQLEDFLNGAKDQYWVKAEIPADELSEADQRFLLQRFFDINPRIIARFPRYQELAALRGDGSPEAIEQSLATWQARDYRDLQVLFNLAWTDPDWLAQEPLLSLVQRGSDFSEWDKALIFQEHLRLIGEVIPTHAAFQEAGQIEVTTTPFAHPILPLLVDSNIAAVAMPEADLPPQFVFGKDGVGQVQLAVQMYEERFGRAPRGMWPAEGSVSQDMLQMLFNAGIQWIATDEAVLANSLLDFEDFTRNSADTVQQADSLYRPYTVTGGRGGEVSILFRDHLISDKLGFTYSGVTGQEAADDLMGRLTNIQAQLAAEGATGPNLVTILLDGENPWEYYENDGKDFLLPLYQQLSDSETIQTITPSDFIAQFGQPERQIEALWPGSWITPDYSTWIGEEEENLAWTYLLRMRQDVERALDDLDAATQAEVIRLVYIAEGSDWFWWYGSDQNSGVDENFDLQFRRTLERIYRLIGQEPPSYVYVPIIALRPQATDREPQMMSAVTVDGQIGPEEWETAGYYALPEGLTGLYFGTDAQQLYIRLSAPEGFDWSAQPLELYLRTPDADEANAFPRDGTPTVLGFGARRMVEIRVDEAGQTSATLLIADGQEGWAAPSEAVTLDQIALAGNELELALPLAAISPAARSSDRLNLRLGVVGAEQTALLPANGSILAIVPEQPIENVVLEVQDPSEDDYGPGGYAYPLDVVFKPGAYDATQLVVGYDAENVVFQITLRGRLVNDWNSPNGMGILSLDVYVDTDGAASGQRLLLPGRNLALTPDHAWDYAILAEGWESAIYEPIEGGIGILTNTAFEVSTNPTAQRVTIRVPRSLMEGDPATWAYLVTIASQEGFPSTGVLRIRDVLPQAERWKLGGGLDASNATRVLDVILPAEVSPGQAELLSQFTPSQADVDDLSPDDFAKLPMLTVE